MIYRKPIVLLVFLLASTALAQKTASAQKAAAPADAKDRVDEIFARFHRSDSPGCAVGASIGDEIVLSTAYGMADLEHNAAIAPETVFEPGSITKQFTAAAVLLLAQQGKLSLEDPVRKYIPELPDYGTPITVRHLLNHTSGLRDWGSVAAIGGWPRTTRAYTHAHVLEILSRQRALNYPAGAEYSYTNSGYNLAAILVSRVAGESLPEFTRHAIFEPLGMNSTQWRDDFRRIVRNRAIAYSGSGAAFRTDMPFEDVFGNGGLLTTVGDLLRWNRNFTEMKVGGRALIDAQHVQGRLTGGRVIAYAAGLMVLHWKGLPEVSHSGSTAGYSAWLGRYPEQSLSVAVLCNLAGTNATQLGHQVADLYLAGAIPQHPADTHTPVDAATLSARAGLYRSVRDHHTVSVDLQDGQLRLNRQQSLKPLSADTFTLGDGDSRAEFETDGSGKVLRMRIASEADPNHVYERVERWTPARTGLETLTGEYTSDEAEVNLKVELDNDHLVVRRRPDTTIPLTPVYQDGFSSSLGSIRFLRDSAGRVIELSLGDSRVWDLRFRRLPAATEKNGTLPAPARNQ